MENRGFSFFRVLGFGDGWTKFSNVFNDMCEKIILTSNFEIYLIEILVKFENWPKLCTTSSFSLIFLDQMVKDNLALCRSAE
jgi:hypothetical protein